MSELIQKLNSLRAEFKFKEIIELCDSQTDLSSYELEFKAHALFELADFDRAELLYRELELFNAAGMCLVMQDRLDEALTMFMQAKTSSARKWGLFLVLLLSGTTKIFPGPGFLTFRLFFESTYYYFLKFDLVLFLQRINAYAAQLEPIYPDIHKEITKAKGYLRHVANPISQ